MPLSRIVIVATVVVGVWWPQWFRWQKQPLVVQQRGHLDPLLHRGRREVVHRHELRVRLDQHLYGRGQLTQGGETRMVDDVLWLLGQLTQGGETRIADTVHLSWLQGQLTPVLWLQGILEVNCFHTGCFICVWFKLSFVIRKTTTSYNNNGSRKTISVKINDLSVIFNLYTFLLSVYCTMLYQCLPLLWFLGIVDLCHGRLEHSPSCGRSSLHLPLLSSWKIKYKDVNKTTLS